MEILLAPVRLPLDGTLARIVRLSDGSGRVESWDGTRWVPGGADAAAMLDAPLVTPAEAAAIGLTLHTGAAGQFEGILRKGTLQDSI